MTSEVPEIEKTTRIGQADSFLDDSEFVDYVELLTASNINFDIIAPDKISYDTFIIGDTIRYTSIIFTTPLSSLTDSVLSIINEVSYKLGISLISSYANVEQRSKSFFGIQTFRGKRYLWPLKIRIIRWPRDINKGEVVASYGLISGLPGVRKRGFRGLALKRTLAKFIKLFSNLFLPYIKVDLSPGADVFSTDLKGNPLAWSYKFGKGTNYYFALHGDLFLDRFNEMHRLVRTVIEANSGYGMVSVDLENTMILRLDDPGACSTDYLDNRKILEEEDWENIGRILEDMRIPLSVVYTPGWVDDGDIKSGALFIDDEKISDRKAGAIYDSGRVKYLYTKSGRATHDHISEFRGLKKLVEKGLVDVQSHGWTHLDSDHKGWSKAKSRNKDTGWYHEFYRMKTGKEANRDEQLQAMKFSREKIKDLFGQVPAVFTPSGHQQSPNSDLLAYTCRYLLFSSEFMGIFKENIAIRNWRIPSLFLYFKNPSNFAAKSGYPFVGVFHDYEIKQHGVDSLRDVIKGWQSRGIKRVISLTELATNLCISVVGYWSHKEKKFRIIISAPTSYGKEEAFSKSDEIKIWLRVIPPCEAKMFNDYLSIEGRNLTVVPQGAECSPSNDIRIRSAASDENPSMRLCLSVSSPRIRK